MKFCNVFIIFLVMLNFQTSNPSVSPLVTRGEPVDVTRPVRAAGVFGGVVGTEVSFSELSDEGRLTSWDVVYAAVCPCVGRSG